MNDEALALRDANDRFYRALESLDLPTMDAVWCQEGWVRCIHPGWDALVGWPAVRRSWAQIFQSTPWMRVTPTEVEVRIYGELGVVACAENITAGSEGDVGVAVAQATNLFLKTPQGWRMIHHHASSAPVQVTQPFSGTIQ
jgi:SnoaL-like protein